MKRKTIALVVGNEVHVVSCMDEQASLTASGILEALKYSKATVLGSGILDGNHVRGYVDTEGKRAHYPNRVTKRVLRDIADRHAFAKLSDVAPAALKIAREASSWHEVECTVLCANCGSEIPGKKRVKGATSQKFVPNNKQVFNVGKKWYEPTCTTRTTPPAEERRKEVQPVVSKAIVTVTFTGSVAEVEAAIQEYAKGRK